MGNQFTKKREEEALFNHPLVKKRMEEAQAASDALIDRANEEIRDANERARLAENNAAVALQHSENLRKDLEDAKDAVRSSMQRADDAQAKAEDSFKELIPGLALSADINSAHEVLDALPTPPPRFANMPCPEGEGIAQVELSLLQRLMRLQR